MKGISRTAGQRHLALLGGTITLMVVLLTGSVAQAAPPSPSDTEVVWFDHQNGKVARANGDGGDANDVAATTWTDAIAARGDHVYYVENNARIMRANADGTGSPEQVREARADSQIRGVAVDDDHLYWGEFNYVAGTSVVGRADLDGSNAEDEFISTGYVVGYPSLAVDDQHIYWASPVGIGRANIDGSGATSDWVFTGHDNVHVIAVDAQHPQHLYFATHSFGIGRVNTDDGSGFDPYFTTQLDLVFSIAVQGDYLYWVSPGDFNDGVDTGVYRANLDGSDATRIATLDNINYHAPIAAVGRPAASSDADLSDLTVDQGTLAPAFDTATNDYTVDVPYADNSFSFTPTVEESHATITVNGNPASSGDAAGGTLQVGANVFTVVVTAQDGTTTRTYTVTVTRAAPSTNAALTGLTVAEGTLSPAFAAGTYAYQSSVGHAVTQAHFTLGFNDDGATVTFPGGSFGQDGTASMNLQAGTNLATFTVTAQDGTTTLTYTVTITRAAAPSTPPTAEPTPSPRPVPAPAKPAPAPDVTVITEPTDNTGRSTKPGALPPATSSEFTTNPSVELQITAPSGATHVVISNHADFSDARTVPVSADGRYGWTLIENGPANGNRTVYVRFAGAGTEQTPVMPTTVKLDDKAPVINKPRSLRKQLARTWLTVPAVDPASGVAFMQFAADRKRPWAWRRYTANVSVRAKQTFVWVRTADAAGNVSAWQKISFGAKNNGRQ